MPILTILLALLMSPSIASAGPHDRRFVLVVFQVLESGQLHSLPFESNTFTTEAACDKAGQKIQQQLSKSSPKISIAYACLDRGSTT